MPSILENKIRSKKATLAVVGLGYVGLPLALAFAKKGFRVFGLDKDIDRVHKLQRNKSYILDVSSADIVSARRKKLFTPSNDFRHLHEIDIVIICVPTPLKRKYTPDISFILDAVKIIRKYIRLHMLIVLESTTYPGTTEELIKPELEKSGLKAEKDFFLSFSPERIDPGNKNYSLAKIPKVVGGLSSRSTKLTALLYGHIIRKVHSVSSAKAAEMTKLLENSFRIINIGWINEVAMMCHKLGIDVWEVIEAAKTKPFGFMPFYPGLGVGGHCIPDDPLYLYWKAKLHGFSSKFIKLSADINSSMAGYAVERIHALLKKSRKNLSGSKILVVGVTYKKNVKDLRRSTSLTLIEQLKSRKCRVDYYDPVIPYLAIGTIHQKSIKLNRNNLLSYDCVVIATNHTHVDYRLILKNAKLIFDTRNVYHTTQRKNLVRL